MAEYLSPAVFIEEPPSGIRPIQAVGTSVGAFVGLAERGPIGIAEPLDNYGQFVRVFGGPIDDAYLAFAVKAFFDEGGSSCYVVRTSHYTAGAADAVPSENTFQNAGVGAVDALTVQASTPGAWGNTLTVEVAHVAPDLFTLRVGRAGQLEETLAGLSMDPLSVNYAPIAIARQSILVRAIDEIAASSTLGSANRRPAPTTAPQLLGSGSDGLTGLVTADFVGNAATANGLHALDAVTDVNLVAVPDAIDRDVHVQAMAYCEARQDCFYIADTAEAAVTSLQALGYKRAQGAYAGGNAFNSKYGALYAPWVDVIDSRSGAPITVPPCGAVMGRYARTDGTRGVHKAPAGVVDGRLASVVGLAAAFSQVDQERLNPAGINVIRQLAGTGNVIWGARTVSSDPAWRYLNVRRLFLFIERSIALNINWTVFEPNDSTLRKTIVRNVSAFLRLQWLAGALVGATEDEAYFVKCDEENNPPESVLLGRLITEIGVSPSKPAEFVIFRIEQYEGGSDVSE